MTNITSTQSKFGDLIISLHDLARNIEDTQIAFKVRLIANDLAVAGNEYESYTRSTQISLDL